MGKLFESGGYAKLRMWIVAAFIADVVLTFGYIAVAGSGGPSAAVEAWFEPSFPSNILVVRNFDTEPIEDVELIVDGRYRAQLSQLMPGPTGLTIDRDFHDGVQATPPATYEPRRLELRTVDDVVQIRITRRGDE